MRTTIHDNGFTLWASANDTYDWATKPGAAWPCSTLSDKRFVASFDSNGLCDLSVNGRDASDDIDGWELSAMIADFMRDKLPETHICRNVAVDQFGIGRSPQELR